jgi:hypothetical protein
MLGWVVNPTDHKRSSLLQIFKENKIRFCNVVYISLLFLVAGGKFKIGNNSKNKNDVFENRLAYSSHWTHRLKYEDAEH